MESPGAYVTECFTRSFLLGPVLFRTAFPCSGGYHLEKVRMQRYDAVGIKCEDGRTTIKAQVSIWAKGCMIDDCMSVI